jgi:uncharacterized protein YcbK (DUF882 family)
VAYRLTKKGSLKMVTMTNEDWTRLKYFSKKENWGDPFLMNRDLILKLHAMRIFTNKPFIIHCGYATSGHSFHSQHYLGNAVDFHIKGLSPLEQFLIALKFGFKGYGIYGKDVWNNPGLHLDVRPSMYPIFWGWTKQDGEVLLDTKFIKHLLKLEEN